MKRLTLIFNLLICLLFLAACESATPTSPKVETPMKEIVKPTLAHTVYFWLKEGTSDGDKVAFENGLRKLGTCPTLHTFHWGTPASTEDRDVVDHSYDYAINSFFASIDDQNAYQIEPIHLEFIENHQHIWESVKVYDNVMK